MHELSIAHSLVDVAAAAAERAGAAKVVAVQVAIGTLSGVSIESLLFCFDIAASGTLLEGSRLVIREVPLAVYCSVCSREVALAEPNRFRCPDCGAPTPEIRRGRELAVESLEIEEPPGRTDEVSR